MVLKNKKIFLQILLFFIFNNSVMAKIILPELLTKQAVSNIRFLSRDGKFTYYQKRSGSLLFSSNYKVFEMIKGKMFSQYSLIATPAQRKILITQNENFNSFYASKESQKIFIVNFGETATTEVGFGSSPQLHLNDSWLSYYDHNKKVIHFENTNNRALAFFIKLNNSINPYFVPQVVMSDDNTVYYTDLNQTGAVGIISFKRSTEKTEIIFKAPTPMVKAEICLNQAYLVMGLFGINSSNEGSVISRAKLPIDNFSKREVLYTSSLNDVGQLLCNGNKNFSFIKNTGTNEFPETDLFELDPDEKKISPLSELKTITSAIDMDGILLVTDKGKYFIAKGNVDYKNIDSLKALPPTSAARAIEEIDNK